MTSQGKEEEKILEIQLRELGGVMLKIIFGI
jgi:hypothetical protein